MYKPGDEVSVIHELITGKVIKVDRSTVTIRDQDGFSRNFHSDKLVPRKTSADYGLNSIDIESQIIEKINASFTESKQIVISKKNIRNTHYDQEAFELDLHIESLTEDFFYMSNMEILQRQMLTCRMFVEKAIQRKAKKIVLIHGKGEGVLKAQIHAYLNRLEDTKPIAIIYKEASFSNYGGGATEVILRY